MTRKRIIGTLCFIFALICLCVMHGYAEEPELTPEGSGRFCYDRLDESLRKTYNEIAAGVAAFVESEAYEEEDFTEQTGYFTVDVTNATYGDVTRAFAAFYFDNPQYFWMHFNTFLQDADGNDISSLPCDEVPIWIYSEYYKRLDRSVAEILIESEAKDWVKELRGEATDYDRVVRLHDMICDAVDYAEDADGGKGYKLWAYNIDGVLNKKGAVCQGYAATFSYILNLLGIDNAFIPGVTDSGENHTWNAVYLDDAYYLIDVTWDDTTGTYLYFFMPADTFETEHIQGRMNGVTQDFFVTTEAYGNDSEYQFYTYTGAYVPSNVSDEDLEAYLEGALDHRYHDEILFISDDAETLKRIHKELTAGIESLLSPIIYDTEYGYAYIYEVKKPVELNAPILTGYLNKDEDNLYLNNTLCFEWGNERNATSYRMYRSKTVFGEKEYVGRYNGTSRASFYKYDADYYYFITAYYLPAGQESEFSTPLKIDVGEVPLDSNIYYSDLFYVYDSAYLTNGYLATYESEIQGIMHRVTSDYINSIWNLSSQVKSSIHATVHWDEWCRLVSDAVLGTSFMYDQALDAANLKFIQNMMNEAWWQTASSELSGTFEKAKKIGEYLEELGVEVDYTTMTTDEIFVLYLEKVQENQVFVHISSVSITEMKTINISKILGTGVKYGSEALNIVKTLAVGMLLEDLRLEMVNRLIQEAPANSALHQGMVRLKSQIESGFVEYFLKNYVTEIALEKLGGEVMKAIFSKNFLMLKACASLIVDVTTDIVFASVPNVEDYLVLRVLHEYSQDLGTVLHNCTQYFQKEFTTWDIEMYAILFDAYVAVNNAGLQQAQKFDQRCNRADLSSVITKYGGLNYSSYIRMVKSDINSLSSPKKKIFDSWTIRNGALFHSVASDTIESNYIYTDYGEFKSQVIYFTGSGELNVTPKSQTVYLYGDVIIDGNLIIAKDTSIVIEGNVTLSGTLTISEDAILTIKGNLTLTNDHGHLTVTKNAVLTVDGTIDLYASWETETHLDNHGILNAFNIGLRGSNCFIYQTEEDAQLILKGYFAAFLPQYCHITAGTVIFNGTEVQEVYNLNAYNVEVLNPNGIKYLSNIIISGTFDVHQNPILTGARQTIFKGVGGFGTLSENQSDWITTVPPTTESTGERHKECLICGETVCREEIPIMVKPDPENCEHSFGAWTVVTAPTCTETGSDSRVCPLCDLEETRTTDALGHDHDSVVTAPTCTEQGHTTHTCSRCGDSYTDSVTAAMGHTPGAEADCLNDQVCTVCGTVLVGKLGHDYRSAVTAPTCTEQGHTTHTCSRCGDSYTDSETAAMGHTPGEWIVDQEPAPGVEGSKHVECTVCHHVLETAAIEAHPVETAPESEPESEHESEPESEPESETEPETDEEPETNGSTEPESETESETEKPEESGSETTTDLETNTATEPETAEDTEIPTEAESKQPPSLPSFGCSGALYMNLLGMILVAVTSSLILKKRKED